MFSDAPDSAARTFLFTSILWMVVGTLALAIAGLKLVSPDFLGIGYGKLAATASSLMQYGWLDLATLGALFYLLPRLTGTRMKEGPGLAAAIIINLCLVLNTLMTLGGVQGRPYAEMPGYLFGVYFFAHLLVMVNVLATVVRSTEKRPFVGVWHLAAASIAMPFVLGLARLPHLTGSAGILADGFALNSVLMLWFASVGIAASYYVVARASGQPFYNHRVAMVGFWVLVFAAPLTGAGRQTFSPTPDWVQSVGTAASIALISTAIVALIGVVGTLRGAWDRIQDHPSIQYMAAGSALFTLAILQGAFQSMRSVARSLGTTGVVDSQIWLLIGAFTLWMSGLIVYALPRLMGRRWLSSVGLSRHFWLTFMGFLVMAGAMLIVGIVQAAVLNAGIAVERPLSSGLAFDVVLASVSRLRIAQALGGLLIASGGLVFALNVLRSTSMGESRPVEVVVAEGAA